jgi:hypothetical protein
MSLIWAAVFFLSGVAIYLVVPVLVGPVLPRRARDALAHWYYRQAAAVGNRLQIVERDHGTHTLLATNYRAEWGDEGVLDDEKGHWRDNGNHMGRFYGRPMGLVSERFDVVAHPRHCEIGRVHRRLAERGRDELELTLQQGGEAVTVLAQEIRAALPSEPRAVSAHDIEGVLGDSGGPRLGETSFEYAKKSQSRFGKRNVVEVMVFVLAYAASFGMMWFFAEQSGTISRTIPMWIGVGL